jgi:hypothetical protein
MSKTMRAEMQMTTAGATGRKRKSKLVRVLRYALWIGVLGLLVNGALLVAHRWYRFALFLPFRDRYVSLWLTDGELQLEWNFDREYLLSLREEEDYPKEYLEDSQFAAYTIYWPLTVPHRQLTSLSCRGFIGAFGVVDIGWLWFVIAPAALIAVSAAAIRCLTRRHKVGFCSRCGYDLTGNVSGVCPECGTAVAKTGAPSAPRKAGSESDWHPA